MGESKSPAGAFFAAQPQYSMQGVLAFLQSAHTTHEQEQSNWARERKQLQDQIQKLDLQCKTHEKVQEELVQRIKMLEYALSKEREQRFNAANQSSQQGGSGFKGTMGTMKGFSTVVLSSDQLDEYDPSTPQALRDPQWSPGLETRSSIEDFFSGDDGQDIPTQEWTQYATLRSHLDGVRDVAISSSGTLVLSASDDASLKLWSLKTVKAVTKDGTVPADVEPMITYRGHVGRVTCCALEPSARMEHCYSGGEDGIVRVWSIPPVTQDLYDCTGVSVRQKVAEMGGHTDVIWSLAVHPVEPLLFSASADRTVKVWDTKHDFSDFQDLLFPLADLSAPQPSPSPTPISLQVLQTDSSKVMVAYDNGALIVFDINSATPSLVAHTSQGVGAKEALELPTNYAAQPNRIAGHNSLPLVASVHDDGALRLMDVGSGRSIHGLEAHQGAATSVCFDASALYAVTTGIDGFVKIWDLRQRVSVFEARCHSRVQGEAGTAVAAHPLKALIISGGVDSDLVSFTRTS